MGCDNKLINLLKNMYTDVYIQCAHLITPRVQLHKGVKQGCPISMTLFCFSGLRFSILGYADDLVVIANYGPDLLKMLTHIIKTAVLIEFSLTTSI